jgi:hypothetical protein|tara:strand:- start:505 stop:669 length:165 start_codon:yes stop_codon:yes gene_type:complete
MRDKESFNYKLVRSSTGRLADEAKREEYEWQMRQKKKTPPSPPKTLLTGPTSGG